MNLSDEQREHFIMFCLDAAEDADLKEHKKSFYDTATILINGRSPEQVKKMEIAKFGRAMGN